MRVLKHRSGKSDTIHVLYHETCFGRVLDFVKLPKMLGVSHGTDRCQAAIAPLNALPVTLLGATTGWLQNPQLEVSISTEQAQLKLDITQNS